MLVKAILASGSFALDGCQRLLSRLVTGVNAQGRFEFRLALFQMAQAQEPHTQNGMQRRIGWPECQRLAVARHGLVQLAGVGQCVGPEDQYLA